MAGLPKAETSLAAASIFSGLRLINTTLAPAAANRLAIPRLIPLEPPATKAVLPASWVS